MKRLLILALLIGCKEIPTTNPSPTPTASPCQCESPTPCPVPTATAVPTATPWACNLPAMPNCAKNAINCCKEGGLKKFHPMIRQAQDELKRLKPSMFRANGAIDDEVEYTTELAKVFQNMFKICAVGGANDPISKDEMGIKETNGQAVHVDVVIGGSNMPYVGGEYTCSPSAF